LNKSKNILICPLEWGLGHAARMIPMAVKLREMNNNVIIASGEEHLSLLRTELPGLSYICFPGFKPVYSKFLPQYLSLLFKVPLLLYHIVAEHHKLKKIIAENNIDIIISDNRFGLWNKNITSVYITHMPLIPFPAKLKILEPVGVLLHRKIIKKYSLCFIPDLRGDLNLSGRLSHGIKLPDNVRYIGILSRFNDIGHIVNDYHIKSKHNTVILSGPEPQKEILKQKLVALLKQDKIPTIIFEGKPSHGGEIAGIANITFYRHLPALQMKEIIQESECIITRSGYTTIMELVSMNRSALIIPTPGQTEQEYLAEYLSEKGWFNTVSQSEIKEGIQLHKSKIMWQDEINRQSSILLNKALNELLEKQHKESQTDKSC
jgi:spore coat polysaccharide biosynthesis predicted glycosyltransferase SpsG